MYKDFCSSLSYVGSYHTEIIAAATIITEAAFSWGEIILSAHSDYVTQPYDITPGTHMIIDHYFTLKNGLEPLDIKNTPPSSLEPPTDIVSRGPNPISKVIKLSCF